MRMRIALTFMVLGVALGTTGTIADDGGFAGVRVEYAPKRSPWSAMTPGQVVEQRQHDGSVIAALNGNGMMSTRLGYRDGRAVVSCGDADGLVDFRRLPRQSGVR